MKVVAVAAAVLVLAGPALAATPAGFREAPKLEPAASWVAGKPVKVWCATSQARWAASSAVAKDAYGYADFVGGGEAFLAPDICMSLRQPPGTVSDAYGYGVGLSVLLHEAEHLAGVADESAADCGALRVIAPAAIRFFGIRSHRLLHVVAASAWTEHDSLPDSYQTLC